MSTTTTRRVFLKAVSAIPACNLALFSRCSRNSEITEDEPNGGETSATSTTPTSILERSPFVPQNLALVDPVYYPTSRPFGNNGPSQTEDEVRTQLQETFSERFDGDQHRVARAMSAFDDPVLKGKCPDPELRGATVALQGTSGAAAFDAIVNDSQIMRIEYADVRDILKSTRALAYVAVLRWGSIIIRIDERLKGEDIRALAPTILHEALHVDAEVSAKEELIANTIETINYGEFVVEAPSLARQDTELVRRANTELMARLNSRDETGVMRLLVSQGPLLPESTRTDLEPFADLTIYTTDTYPTWQAVPNTPGNPQLNSVLRAQTGVEGQSWDFDDQTMTALDRNQISLSSEDQQKLLEALELEPTSPGT
jgi:hypothetical protein